MSWENWRLHYLGCCLKNEVKQYYVPYGLRHVSGDNQRRE